ncbi:MAG TPA: polyphenol oxidase family protein [Patescibacteria group bacterium]|jgi:copper oxidase (laccase) domain-containing protein|nr:polyphenol oxidase family protein [Patescibacteria group bacterium]
MIKADQPTIFDYKKLRVIVSSASDGNISPRWGSPETVRTNIDGALEAMGEVPKQVIVLKVADDQNNWDSIREVEEGSPSDIAADALVTKAPGLALWLPIADCCPVVMHDPVHRVVALAHLGWQSTNVDLANKVVAFLKQNHQTSPADLLVYAGPCIKAESYVFTKQILAKRGILDDPRWQPFLHDTSRGIEVDIVGYNINDLQTAGVQSDHIQVCPVNTGTSLDYFSHHRSSLVPNGTEPEGRFATVCMLV